LTTNILDAIALTTFAGLATGIGSLISYLVPKPDLRYLSISLGFATGVMIFLAFVNLFCSSRAEMGATAAILVLYPFLRPHVLSASTAMVAGMMAFISFDEPIPVANRYGGEHLTNLGIVAGFMVMIAASSLLCSKRPVSRAAPFHEALLPMVFILLPFSAGALILFRRPLHRPSILRRARALCRLF
jgi:zinc transporter ZupT